MAYWTPPPTVRPVRVVERSPARRDARFSKLECEALEFTAHELIGRFLLALNALRVENLDPDKGISVSPPSQYSSFSVKASRLITHAKRLLQQIERVVASHPACQITEQCPLIAQEPLTNGLTFGV